jgi:hypothetical protein
MAILVKKMQQIPHCCHRRWRTKGDGLAAAVAVGCTAYAIRAGWFDIRMFEVRRNSGAL